MQLSLEMDHAGNVVPFGKYRGQPLAALQADPQYVEWLRGQAWLADRYPQFNALIINNFAAPAETPEHNALQARFLDADFVERVLLHYWHTRWGNDRIRVEFPHPPAVRFELSGIDVLIEVPSPAVAVLSQDDDPALFEDWRREDLENFDEKASPVCGVVNKDLAARLADPYRWQSREKLAAGLNDYLEQRHELEVAVTLRRRAMGYERTFSVEIKTSMGDDYPVVLRQMDAARKRMSVSAQLLLVDQYHGRGVPWPTVRQMFRRSDVHALRLAEVA